MTQRLNSLKFVSHIQYVSPCLSTTGSDLQKKTLWVFTHWQPVWTLYGLSESSKQTTALLVCHSLKEAILVNPCTIDLGKGGGSKEINLPTVKSPDASIPGFLAHKKYCLKPFHFCVALWQASGLETYHSLPLKREAVTFSSLDLGYSLDGGLLIWQFDALICLTYGLLDKSD